MILETERLILRKLRESDLVDLCKILCDEKCMYAYEHAFTLREAKDWLEKQLRRYAEDGFGLWAAVLKETGALVGQCGLTLQEIPGKTVTEVGYLFRKEFWHKGFATEAAVACKQYAFQSLGLPEVYSIIRENNLPSQNVAKRNGMRETGRFTKHYYGTDMPHIVFRARKDGAANAEPNG